VGDTLAGIEGKTEDTDRVEPQQRQDPEMALAPDALRETRAFRDRRDGDALQTVNDPWGDSESAVDHRERRGRFCAMRHRRVRAE
jgi:hypothetical protein